MVIVGFSMTNNEMIKIVSDVEQVTLTFPQKLTYLAENPTKITNIFMRMGCVSRGFESRQLLRVKS